MLQQMALLKGFNIADMNPKGTEFVHTMIECAKLAFADRETFYGDPKFVDVPLEHLLSESYNEERRHLIDDHANLEFRAGKIKNYGQKPLLIKQGKTFGQRELEAHE